MPPVFHCSSFPALLGMDSRRGNLCSFSVELKIDLAAAELLLKAKVTCLGEISTRKGPVSI